MDPEQKEISRGPWALTTKAEWTVVLGPYDMQKWVGECCASGQTKQHQCKFVRIYSSTWGDHMEPMSPLRFRARSLPATASRDGWSLLGSWKPGEMAYVCASCDSCGVCCTSKYAGSSSAYSSSFNRLKKRRNVNFVGHSEHGSSM
jgi:hypothetical protein